MKSYEKYLYVVLLSLSFYAKPLFAEDPEQAVESGPPVAQGSAEIEDPKIAEKIRLKEEFRKALMDVRARLKLNSIENRIFEREALSTADSFVETYSSSQDSANGKVHVQVNDQKLLEFIRFNAKNKTCLKVKAKTNCKNCESWISNFSSGLLQNLAERGMLVKPTDDVSLSPNLNGSDAFEDFLARSVDLSCEASILVEVSASSLEKRRLDFFAQVPDQNIKNVGRKTRFDFTVDTMGENLETQSLVNRSSVALYTGWHENRLKEKQVALTQDYYLTLNDVDQFSKLYAFKNKMQSSMPDVRLEERMISPSRFVFAVKSTRSLTDIARELGGMGVQVRSASATDIQVSLR